MYVLLVYDIGEKRVNKVLKICRQYLDWVQNSVLEGELTKASLETLKKRLERVINKDLTLEVLGIDKKQVADDGII